MKMLFIKLFLKDDKKFATASLDKTIKNGIIRREKYQSL